MLIAARNGFMAGKNSILPPGARWVEYLESTGTQYIDTGVYPAQLTKAEIDMQFSSLEKCSVLGSNNGGANNSGWNNLFAVNTDISYFLCQWGLGFGGNFVKDTTRHLHTFERNGDTSWTYTVDNMSLTKTTGIITQPASNQRVLYLFACNNNGTLYRQSYSKIWKCKIHDNGALVRDFHPIAIGNTGYMLDLVSGEYLQYGNKGTGDFVIGPDK